MNRRGWMGLVTILALCLCAALTAPQLAAQVRAAQGQGEHKPSAKKADAQKPDSQKPEGEQKPSGEDAVEEILRQQEALITGEGFTYNPEGRRDPFRSPFGQGDPLKPRPAGIDGMMVTEIDLVGVVNDPKGGNMAMVTGSDAKGYFLRVGDQVYDGTVIAIDPDQGTVTFRQKVDDPRMIKPYRDIVKRVVPLDDEESGNE